MPNESEYERIRAIAREANEERLRDLARAEAIKAAEEKINEYSLKFIGLDWKAPTQPFQPAILLRHMAEEMQRDEARRKLWGTTLMAVLGAVGMALLSAVIPIVLKRIGVL